MKRRKIMVVGATDNDLATFACQQLDINCYEQFDIICHTVPLSANADKEKQQAYGQSDQVAKDFIDDHYDILISIGFKVVQVLPKIPSYDEILFWDTDYVSDQYAAITENINFFISKYKYGRVS